MTVFDLINSPDPANWELALTIANSKELAQIAEALQAQVAQCRKAEEDAMEQAQDCMKKIMLETDKHDFHRALTRALNANEAERWAKVKLRAVLDIINANQLKLELWPSKTSSAAPTLRTLN